MRQWTGSTDGWLRSRRFDRGLPWGRHEEPFSKRRDGRDRRAERQQKLREREQMLNSRERDDGYFSMSTWRER